MEYFLIGIAFVVGGLIGYFAFYFSYKDQKTIKSIKDKLEKIQKELDDKKADNDKVKDENKILREKSEELLMKYDDMSRVIAELSRYSKLLKEGGEIAKKLAEKLGVYDSEIHDRMQRVLDESGFEYEDEQLDIPKLKEKKQIF